jgi:hypothetical protein
VKYHRHVNGIGTIGQWKISEWKEKERFWQQESY